MLCMIGTISQNFTVSSFYIDETEVRNIDYVEYLEWIKKHYVYENSPFFTGTSRPEIYTKALPDTLVWRDKLGENEMFLNNYLRHPAYREYPVVGVSWEQANDYCTWRTDRVNERILIDATNYGSPSRSRSWISVHHRWIPTWFWDYLANFVTEKQKGKIKNLKVLKDDDEGRYTTWKMDSYFKLQIPYWNEWTCALGYIGNNIGENHEQRKFILGMGVLRNNTKQNQGQIMANFKRGRGDNMEMGSLNDILI